MPITADSTEVTVDAIVPLPDKFRHRMNKKGRKPRPPYTPPPDKGVIRKTRAELNAKDAKAKTPG